MKPLSARLKDIYTSGDTYTVLSLLKKLIEVIEEYELDGFGEHLYQHKITIEVNGVSRECIIVNTNPAKLTTTENLDDLYGSKTSEIYYVLSDDVQLFI